MSFSGVNDPLMGRIKLWWGSPHRGIFPVGGGKGEQIFHYYGDIPSGLPPIPPVGRTLNTSK